MSMKTIIAIICVTDQNIMLCFFFLFLILDNQETMQPAKPSFLQYFEQKEKEDNKITDNCSHKLPAEGDMGLVSTAYWVFDLCNFHTGLKPDWFSVWKS